MSAPQFLAPVADPHLVCDCGHEKGEHWFRCRGVTGTRFYEETRQTFPVRCDCTKFGNPSHTIRGRHPGPDCPCVPCFLSPPGALAECGAVEIGGGA